LNSIHLQVALIAFFQVVVCAAHAQVPATVAADEPVIIYLHGRIIEEEGSTPVHPRWGLYDYPEILEALGSNGAIIKSDVRESGTDIYEYAGKTIKLIEGLISQGVSPDRIVVIGFSKGGVITIHVSSFLRRPEIRYVTLAACGDWLNANPNLRFTGHVFSIWEKSDQTGGSCQNLSKVSSELGSFREKRISTGKEHGAFYLPRSDWVEPVLDWIHDNIEPE
jgi:hypothetical protein